MLNKSLKSNAILNSLKQISTIIFPLITFPYVSRILGAENYGKFSFSNSLISYFILLAALGITNYAIREGAGIRDDKIKIEKFSSEVFSINLLFSFISYVALALLIIFWGKLDIYIPLLLIQSTVIIFNTIGVDWLYNIYEDYLYITIRSIIVQFLSLIFMFVFVRDKNDYLIYALITVLSAAGGNIFNFIHSRKYVDLKITAKVKLNEHLSPMLILFCNEMMISIYVNSDNILLGVLKDNTTVGLYSVSVKVYTIIKRILAAILVVTLPRLSYYKKNRNYLEYDLLANKILNALVVVTLPIITGLFMESKNVILLIAGSEYLEGTASLKLLSFALGFAIIAAFFSTSILLSSKREKKMLSFTIISALTNVLLNFVLIPSFSLNGAAISTIIAEAITAIMSIYSSKDIFKFRGKIRDIIIIGAGCLSIILICLVMEKSQFSTLVHLIITTLISAFMYFLILLIGKNDFVVSMMSGMFKITKRNK